MDKDIFNQMLLIIIPVFTAAAALVIAWLRAKTREINRRTEEDTLKYNLELLDKVVIEVAKTLNQTLVEELEKAHSDGRLSFEDMERVKLEALEHTYSILDESIILMLKKTTNDLDCLICSKIESNLCDLEKCRGEKIG
ncbi:MAG: hypothetical protein ACYCYE_05415 [Clostridia bacterium]